MLQAAGKFEKQHSFLPWSSFCSSKYTKKWIPSVENVIEKSNQENKNSATNGGNNSNKYKTYADVVRSNIDAKQAVEQWQYAHYLV